jgi:hypothetical protein
LPGTYLIDHQPAPFGMGRHIHHDPQSKRYPFLRQSVDAGYRPPAVRHERHIPVFDQGRLGDCTAEASLGIMATGPYWDALCIATETRDPAGVGPYPFNQHGAVALYHDITTLDPFVGTWPPDDTGSDGLSAAQALQRAGAIPGYQHTFSLNDALAALTQYPLLVGTYWTDDMFYPDRHGLISYTGEAVGGHEWIADEYVPGQDLVGGTTSWGTSFGVDGRFYLTVQDFGRLLADDGDVIVLTPPTAPAPEPIPDPAPVPDPTPTPGPGRPDAADVALRDAFAAWVQARGL